jgi:uncharacterized protein YdaU (DUF1376 family)
MHYYQFNIGDYKSHTNHLDLLEDLAYRRLLDLYYLHERPLSVSVAAVARQIGMREYEDKVYLMLEEFFHNSEEGWVNPRADREIKHFHSKIEQASRAGKASAQRRSNGRSTDVQPNNKQEPINKKQDTKKTVTTKVVCPPSVDQQVWEDWLTIRRAKKLPLTETAWHQIQGEIEASGLPVDVVIKECCLRGWAAFKVNWLKENPISTPSATRFAGDI